MAEAEGRRRDPSAFRSFRSPIFSRESHNGLKEAGLRRRIKRDAIVRNALCCKIFGLSSREIA